jgi:hypothetical protein
VVPVVDQILLGYDDDYMLCSDPHSQDKYPNYPNCTMSPQNWVAPWPPPPPPVPVPRSAYVGCYYDKGYPDHWPMPCDLPIVKAGSCPEHDTDQQAVATPHTEEGGDWAAATLSECRSLCAADASHPRYFAVQNGGSGCFCGDRYGKYGPSTACNMTCAGGTATDPAQACGGSGANSIYRIAVDDDGGLLDDVAPAVAPPLKQDDEPSVAPPSAPTWSRSNDSDISEAPPAVLRPKRRPTSSMDESTVSFPDASSRPPHAGRETISFNFAWRWRRGEPETPAASCPSLRAHNMQCPGLSKRRCAQNEFTFAKDPPTGACNDTSAAAECELDCCADPACGLWAWKATEDGSNRCWWSHGKNTSGCTAQPGWVGGARPTPGPRMGPRSIAPAAPEFDDGAWEGVDVPHDARLTEQFDLDMFRGPGKLPFSSSWYRKKFRVPEGWAGKPLFITFGAVMRAAHVYLNGKLIGTHEVGYTAFTLRLDAAGLLARADGTNVLAVFADDRFSSWDGIGWWYGGAGIYRDVALTSLASPMHLAVDGGVFAVPSIPDPETIQMHEQGNGSAGLWAAAVDLNVTLELVSEGLLSDEGGPAAATAATVTMKVVGADGAGVCGSATFSAASAAGNHTFSHVVSVANAELWSVPRPYLYTLVVEISNAAGDIIDVVNTSVGLRSAQFHASDGLHVNEQRVRLKGFCNHNDFTGVGVAVPPRLNLFRAQALRDVGANAWRMSHNVSCTNILPPHLILELF